MQTVPYWILTFAGSVLVIGSLLLIAIVGRILEARKAREVPVEVPHSGRKELHEASFQSAIAAVSDFAGLTGPARRAADA